MKKIFISNLSRPLKIPLKVGFCDTFLCRLRGMLFRQSISEDEGLLLVQKKDSRIDSSIHMIGMLFSLGVVWINSHGEVVDLCLAKPWRPAYLPKKPACWTLEIHPCRLNEFQIGDQICLDETAPA